MQSRWRAAVFLGCIWMVSLLYGEIFSFRSIAWSCSWPALQHNATGVDGSLNRPVRVAVIADPQITDRTSYGQKRGSLSLQLTQFYSDIYMRRAFRSSVLALEPDKILFLGDLFDGGPFLPDEEWRESTKRFEHLFNQAQTGLNQRQDQSTIPVHYLPGNHDLGYEAVHNDKPEVLNRYERKFGSPNYSIMIGGVEFVFVDAQALDGADHSIFLDLLTRHRLANQQLLDLHQKGVIGYQNYLMEVTSTRLLDAIKPVIVLSGHDHDQCYVVHRTKEGLVPEVEAQGSTGITNLLVDCDGSSQNGPLPVVMGLGTFSPHLYAKSHTLGSFSWQQGNIHPSLMMLSVIPGSSPGSSHPENVVASHLCFLPVQIAIYVWYGILLGITIIALIAWPAQGLEPGRFIQEAWRIVMGSIKGRPEGGMKAKNEDANNGDWEMIWDAEGAMHLINKGPKAVPNVFQASRTSEMRGSSVLARRSGHEMDTHTVVKLPKESSDSVIFDQGPGTSVRMVRGKTHSFSARVVQSLGPLAVLAAVNISFYLTLLMNDWT